MPTISQRLQNAWNAFRNPRDPTFTSGYGAGSYFRPDRPRFSRGHERSIVTTIFNRIAVDCAAIDLEHVRLDDDGRYTDTIKSGLNDCLTLSANIDQTGRSFIIDAVQSMFDEGVVALVPVDTSSDPFLSSSFDIITMRTGKVVEWYPQYVRVRVYNDRTGRQEELTLSKYSVAIVENPFFAVMNEPNSTLQRLIRKLNLLDYIDEQSSSGKLDLIIQLPYVIKSQSRREQAEQRRKDIEMQLAGSKYGIAYTDGTERITQLNRSVENNIWTEIKDLTAMLYNQLGITEAILNGTADEQTMINYYNNTIVPIMSALAEEMQRKFLTKTARTQGQAIRYFRDAFKLTPVSTLAELSDKLTRNEIASSNEIRAIIGWKPSDDPKADELINSNLNQSAEAASEEEPTLDEEETIE